jgi:long-chain acyl-CoA synthetase
LAAEDTFPKLLMRNYQNWGNKRVAQRHKKFGVWKEYTWADVYLKVKALALGLLSLGVRPGFKATIIGDGTPEWFWAELAIHCTRGASLGIFTDSLAAEIKNLIRFSDSEIVFAKDQEQVDKLLEIKDELPQIRKVIYWDPKGLRVYEDPILISFEELMKLGTRYEQEHPGIFEQTIEQGKGDDLAVLLPTSGTTGALPKLVMHSFAGLLGCESLYRLAQPVFEDDVYVALTPPGWAMEQVSFATSLATGRATNFPEAPETLQEDLRELGPTLTAMLSTQTESMSSLIQARINDASFLKRLAYRLLLPIGYKRADFSLAGKQPNLFWKALFAFADAALFTPLKDKLGLSKTRHFINFGAMMSVDAARYFAALGLRPKQLYAASEILWTCTHTDADIKLETVGRPLPGVEVRITDEGEIAVKKESRFLGYYKDAERTNKVLRDGWYYTGDAGLVDEDGHVVLLDRMQDVMVLADGGKFSPQYIEGRIKFSPYIKDAVVFGGSDRPFLTVLIIIDFENIARWAEKRNIPFTTFTDLSQKAEVYELVRPDIERVNKTLPKIAKIKKFANFYKDLDPDEAELTRTRKLRRAFFEEHYHGLIEALYSDRETIPVETEIRFADGKVKKITTEVRVVAIAEEE